MLDVWKMDAAAAVQYRLYDESAEEDGELGDSISANRIAGREGTPSMTFFKQWSMRLRRLRDWDFSRVRLARKASHLARFASQEKIEDRAIAFATPKHDHVSSAQSRLG